jgi:ABC transport system ATP-binding/permease protein
LRGFYICPAPTQIGHGDHANARYCRWSVGQIPALSERKHRWIGIFGWEHEITVGGRTARYLPVNHALIDRVARYQFTANAKPSICIGCTFNPEFAERPGKSAEMAVEIDQSAVQHGYDFVDRVRKQESAVEHGDFAFAFGDVAAVEIDGSHGRSFARWVAQGQPSPYPRGTMSQPPIFAFEKLSLQQGGGWLFEDIDLFIGARDRLALIGRNGAGKTTLMKLVAGTVEADRGKRVVVPGTNIVMLDQDPDVATFDRLVDFAVHGDKGPPEYAVRAIADQLGIDLDREAKTASGGEKRRAAICRALASEPDLLLLDEPTNHLDLAAIEWLEEWLTRYRGAFMVISHDRTFLTRLTKQTFWLDRGLLRRNEIGFGGYDAWTEQVFAEDARNASRLDAKLKIEAHWLERGVTARRKRNQGRLAKLWEMRAARAAMMGPQGVAKLGASSDDSKTKTVINAEGVGKSFGDRTIIKDFTLRIQRGDRIGIVGANGTGKTTLIRLLTGETPPDTGKITLSPTLTGIVIDQQRKLLTPEKRVRDVLADGSDWIDVRGVRKHVQGYLKEFLFDPELIEARIGTLSGGEQSRILLAREFAREANLLVLDEPTNDLDLETLDLLQEVIADYDGTVLIVSHDRDFLDRTVTLTLGLDGSGKVDIIAGGYADWEAKRDRRDRPETRRNVNNYKANPPPPDPTVKRPAKLSYKDQRDYELLPQRIEQIDAEIAAAEIEMSDPALYTQKPERFAELTAKCDALRAEKDAAEERWLELAMLVEEMSA